MREMETPDVWVKVIPVMKISYWVQLMPAKKTVVSSNDYNRILLDKNGKQCQHI